MTDGVCSGWYLNGLGLGDDRLEGLMVIVSKVLNVLGYPLYSSPRSKRMFSDHCKMGLLVIKEWLDLSYRDLSSLLPSLKGVMAAGNMSKAPDHSTLRKFAGRVDKEILDKVVGETARLLSSTGTVIAVDATGYSESSASRHYVKRLTQMGMKESTKKDYAKVTLAGDIVTKAVLACDICNSRTGDVKRFAPILKSVKLTSVTIDCVLADKGYDAEYAHSDARKILGKGTEVWIPARECEPKSAKSAKKHRPGGRYRSKMTEEALEQSLYSFRSIIETINSMFKRKMGDKVYGKSMGTIEKEIMFTAIAHNVRLLLDSGWVR